MIPRPSNCQVEILISALDIGRIGIVIRPESNRNSKRIDASGSDGCDVGLSEKCFPVSLEGRLCAGDRVEGVLVYSGCKVTTEEVAVHPGLEHEPAAQVDATEEGDGCGCFRGSSSGGC